jgi:hypothetical protein
MVQLMDALQWLWVQILCMFDQPAIMVLASVNRFLLLQNPGAFESVLESLGN